MNDPIPPMPLNFGLRYVLWIAWSNALTILMTLQAVFTMVTLDPTLVDHAVAHYCLVASCVLGIVIAQLKRNNPPGPPPTKSP